MSGLEKAIEKKIDEFVKMQEALKETDRDYLANYHFYEGVMHGCDWALRLFRKTMGLE